MTFQAALSNGKTTLPDGTTVQVRRGDTRQGRVYVSAVAEFNVLEDLTNRLRRPHKAWRPMVLAALEQIGIMPTRMYWSQYAGCSCPCSPGFRLDCTETEYYAFWIHLNNAPTVDETKSGREL